MRIRTQGCAGKFKRNLKEYFLLQTSVTCRCDGKIFPSCFPIVVNGGHNEFEHKMLGKEDGIIETIRETVTV